MEDILTLKQRAKNSIALGESHFREFKTALEGKPGQKKPRRVAAICGEIGEALVAFTNADGGELFIGVEDDGTITGLQHDDSDINTMLNAINTHILDSNHFPIQIGTRWKLTEKTFCSFALPRVHQKYISCQTAGACGDRIKVLCRHLLTKFNSNEKKLFLESTTELL